MEVTSSSKLIQGTQFLNGQQQQQQQQSSTVTQQRRKKCHGNRKLQRFRKKCYKQGLTKEETQKLIDEYNRNNEQRNAEAMETTTGLNDSVQKKSTRTSAKRKQM